MNLYQINWLAYFLGSKKKNRKPIEAKAKTSQNQPKRKKRGKGNQGKRK